MTASHQPIRWSRILVEGAVIVASILLAFGIDAWWIAEQERDEEQAVLSSLAKEFHTNKSEAESVIATYERSNRLVARMSSLTSAELRQDPTDSLAAMVSALATPRTFDAIRGTVDALIGSGKLGLLTDPNLREALTSFLNMVEDAKGTQAYVSHFAVKVFEAEVKHGGPWRIDIVGLMPGSAPLTDLTLASVPTADEVARLRQDDELMSLSKWTQVLGSLYVGEIRRISAHIDVISSLIDLSLSDQGKSG